MNNLEDRGRLYLERCKQPFWQTVFHLEIEYLVEHLKGCRDILSVGCGPATIEGELAKHGFHVTGLDISCEVLSCAPDRIRTVVGRAEDMAFPRHSFDAVIYVASLQFVDDYRTALDKSAAVVRPGGRLVVMLLNPASAFFQKKQADPASYIASIKHPDLAAIQSKASEHFLVHGEYYLRIDGDQVEAGGKEPDSALFIISGTKRAEP
jgi:SAM-dependent methyltransferase